MSEGRQSSATVERAFQAIINIFKSPRDSANLRGALDSIEHQATKDAWWAAMALAPSEAMLAAAKAAGKYGAYAESAILVPEDMTTKWLAEQVRARADMLDNEDTRAMCGGEPWHMINITLVTRDGIERHQSLGGDNPWPRELQWPPSREVAEQQLMAQMMADIGSGFSEEAST